MTDLAPCPFCGTTDGLYPAHHGLGGGEPYAIDCVRCGYDFTPREGIDVVALWNRRAAYQSNDPGEPILQRFAGEGREQMERVDEGF